MSTPQKALKIARGEAGYVEGRNNWTKYARDQWPDVQNQAWCGSFVGWCYWKAGFDMRGKVWVPYVPYIVAWAKKIGAWTTKSGTQKDGDLVVFNWGGRGAVDHVGIAWRDERPGVGYRSVEGNTSPSNKGSQGNGGGVYVRYRRRSDIAGWVRMDKVLAHYGVTTPKVPAGGTSVPAASKPAKPAAKGKVTVDGRLGRETAKEIQRQLNASPKTKRKLKIDGRLGTNTYKSLQEHLDGNVIDGLIENQSYKPTELGNGVGPHGWRFTGRGSKGSATIRRLQRHLGVKDVDGILYEGTTRAWQRALNAGKF